ncbi:unnamed protein product [Paramecium primaurelia]|uniref:Uncharacterized protein n=1 Tax=Paramecium primaurelia TaxID=5886 RepID=A0A8S1MRF6_PARPR|nr:unnamed protein product [Paramecium primaurelia]
MNYANPFSLTSQTSFLSPKDQRSRLTSFLSQNHSIKSNKSVSPKMNFLPQQKMLRTEQISPKSQFVSQNDNKKFQKKTTDRIKYVSEHSSTPYLYIQKKKHDIHIPLLPKLSPEPKIESSRVPLINIMTEPTITIEEQGEQERSNFEQRFEQRKDQQLLLNKSNNLLQVSQLSNNQDDQLSNSKLSIRSRFKKAVQNSFHSPARKSLFNVIISHEFNALQEVERPQIQKRFEPGNQILALKLLMQKKQNILKKEKYIKDIHLKKEFGLINIDQFNVSTKAFQRKVNLIHQTSSRSLMHQEQFSLLPKSQRKSITSVCSQIQNNLLIVSSDKNTQNIKEKSKEKDNLKDFEKTKFNVIITYENVEKLTFQFNRPKHLNQQKDTTEEITPLKPPQSPRQIVPLALISSKNLQSSRKLDYIQSSRNLGANRFSRLSIQSSVFSEEATNSADLKFDFSKPNLFVRVYYQNKLYKMMQKTNYTKQNLQEVEESFRPKVALTSSTILTNVYTVMSTSEQGVRQRKVTNENLTDKIQFSGILLPKYSIDKENTIYNYDEYFNESAVISSEDSDDTVSLDNFLESPANNKPVIKKNITLKSQQTLNDQNQLKEQTLTYFIKDDPIDEKQLSTGALILIKKIRMAFQMPLYLQPILSVLEQKTKNHLLSLHVKICDDYEMGVLIDTHQTVFEEMLKYQRNPTLNKAICQAIEFRYPIILVGRYNCQTRMIDVEHQDPVSNTAILEKQESKYDKFENQTLLQTYIRNSMRRQSKELKESINKRQTINTKKQNLQGLTKQDSLQVTQPQQWNRRAMLSGELSNPLTITIQQTNQQNSNVFTQTSTVLITKPTIASQQSVFRVVSSKHIDLNSSQQDLSSSFHSSQNGESRRSSKIEQIQHQQSSQTQYTQPPQQQVSQLKMQSQQEDSFETIQDQEDKYHLLQEGKNALSMYMNSLRMRTQIKESQRRQKLDTNQLIKLAIYNNNFIEFMDNIQFIPEMQIDVPLQDGNTFLILAAQCGCKEIVHELVKRGADINIQNDDGNTAVHLALAHGHYKIADMLMEAGGSTHIFNKHGQNAWSVL